MAKSSMEAGVIVNVRIPSPLRSYTGGASEVGIAVPLLAPEHPATLYGVLAALDARYRGLRFRIVDEQGRLRPHVKVFVGETPARDLSTTVPAGRDVMIVAALSGG